MAAAIRAASTVFFSSRRRHTRFDCDWSSDVCSSDLSQRGRARQRDAAICPRAGPARGRARESAARRGPVETRARSLVRARDHRPLRRQRDERPHAAALPARGARPADRRIRSGPLGEALRLPRTSDRRGAGHRNGRAGEHRAAAAARDRAGLAARGPAHGVGPVRRGGLARGLRGAPGEALAPDRGQPPGLAGEGEGPMKGFLFPLVLTALGPWAAPTIIPGTHIDRWDHLIIAALLLGIVNAVIRPVILILTLPLTVLTLGLFIFVVNGISFYRSEEHTSELQS